MDKLTICNSALFRCGAESISSLDDSSKRANIVSTQYDLTLAELLNDSPWNFCVKRTTLEESDTPLFGYAKAYEKPTDCIRVLELEDKVPYRVEGDFIVTNQTTSIKIKYISNDVLPSKFSGSFIKALYLKLAEDISYVMVQSASLQAQITQEAERYLRKARSMNSQEGTPDSRYPEDTTLGTRI